jgi:hypothetical protein
MIATQTAQRQRRNAALLLPPLRAAAALAGAPELAAGLDESPDAAATLVERLRALPEAERRKLLLAAGAAAYAIETFIETLVMSGWPAAAQPLIGVLLALLTLKYALEASLRD